MLFHCATLATLAALATQHAVTFATLAYRLGGFATLTIALGAMGHALRACNNDESNNFEWFCLYSSIVGPRTASDQPQMQKNRDFSILQI